jgi:hypothetical protein
VADAVITLRIIRKGPRTTEILDELADRLRQKDLEPNDRGAIEVRVSGRAPRAWEDVRDALDAAGDDWRQWLHLAPRPPR